VLNITAVRSYDAGDEIVREGEAGDALFIVLDGEAVVHAADSEIAKLGRGQHFGEMALVDRAPRSASVTSVSDSRLMVIRRSDFFDIIRKSHDVAVKLLWSFLGVLSQRLRSTSKELGAARLQLGLDDLLEPLDAPYSAPELGGRLSEIAASPAEIEEEVAAVDLEVDDDYDDLDADTLDADSAAGIENAATEIMRDESPSGSGDDSA